MMRSDEPWLADRPCCVIMAMEAMRPAYVACIGRRSSSSSEGETRYTRVGQAVLIRVADPSGGHQCCCLRPISRQQCCTAALALAACQVTCMLRVGGLQAYSFCSASLQISLLTVPPARYCQLLTCVLKRAVVAVAEVFIGMVSSWPTLPNCTPPMRMPSGLIWKMDAMSVTSRLTCRKLVAVMEPLPSTQLHRGSRLARGIGR